MSILDLESPKDTEFTDLNSFDIRRDLIFVIGCDKSHFEESKAAIASTQRHYPDYPIIYYDLGLTESQKVRCQVFTELRTS